MKLWYTALPIATDLGKYFLPPKRLSLIECRWGWRGLVAFKTSRIRLLGYLPSRCMPLCSRLTPCLGISSLFPRLQPRQGTFKAEAGRVCVLGGKERVVTGKLGPPPKNCCLCTNSKSIKQQLMNSLLCILFSVFFIPKGRFLHSYPQSPSPTVPLLPS